MRMRLAQTRDTLDALSLPPTENTELNYRTSITTPAQDALTTLRLLALPLTYVLVTTIFAHLSMAAIFLLGFGIMGACAVAYFVFRTLVSGRVTDVFFQVGVAALVAVAILIMNRICSGVAAYGWLVGLAATLNVAWALWLGRQAAYWMTAHPRVTLDTMRRWRSYWPPEDWREAREKFPELSYLLAAPLLVLGAYLFGLLLAAVAPDPFTAGIVGLLAFAGSLLAAWCFWQALGLTPVASPLQTWLVAWRALSLWCNYNRHGTPAAGVFLFPTPALRTITVRDVITVSVCALWVLAVSAVLFPNDPPETNVTPARIQLQPNESHTLAQLPPEDRTSFERSLLDEKEARQKRHLDRIKNMDRDRWWAAFRRCAIWTPPVSIFMPLFLNWFVLGIPLVRYYRALEAPNAPDQSPLSPWDVAVDRIINSSDAAEREHLLIGTSLYGDYPVLLDLELLKQHGHILGDTGARKTSMGIAPMVTQLIARKQESVVILDLKGESSLFHTAWAEATRAGLPFRWFTMVPGQSSYVFNPFAQTHWQRMTANQRTQVVMQALSLDYGTGYGRSYYSAMNETVLLNLVRNFPMNSFRELHEFLEDKQVYGAVGHQDDWKQARHLAALANRLAGIFPLNVTAEEHPEHRPACEHAIDMASVFDAPQVLYFFIPAPLESIGAPAVGKLALYSLFTAAAQRRGHDASRVYLFIDEFQNMVSDSVRQVVEHARAMGLSVILAHQTAAQLDRPDVDLTETIDSCTAFKQTFRASDLKTIRRIEETSGQARYHTFQWQQKYTGEAEQDLRPDQALFGEVLVSETVGPRLDRNSIIEFSAHPQISLVRFTQGSGYTQFSGYTTPILSGFHIDKPTYKAREAAAWPKLDEQTVPVRMDMNLPPLPEDDRPPPGLLHRTANLSSQPAENPPEEDWQQRLQRGLF